MANKVSYLLVLLGLTAVAGILAFQTAILEQETKELVIEDTGIGIAPEDLPRIFEKGYTGYNGHADKRSTGIGLYLCRKIMRKLSHEITIESEIGVGTKVHLEMRSRDK